MIAFLTAVWKLITGAATGVVNWLRDPCGCARAIGLVLAVACLYLAVQSYQRGQAGAVIAAQLEAEKARVAEQDAALADIAIALEDEARKLDEQKQAGAKALRELADKLASADARAAEWGRRYAERPASCAAAIAQLDSACPDLRGY